MRYWDASAILPLLVIESTSAPVARLLQTDPDVFTWWGTRIECASAVARRLRTGESTAAAADRALRRLQQIAGEWQEIQATDEVRALAEDFVARYPLRAGDALHLASALAMKRRTAGTLEFMCFDKQLREAADAEGFTVLPAAFP